MSTIAPVVKRISRQSSELLFQVRILAGALALQVRLQRCADAQCIRVRTPERCRASLHDREAVPSPSRATARREARENPGGSACEFGVMGNRRSSLVIFVRIRGIEPRSRPWQGRVLPLNHIRLRPAGAGLRRTGVRKVRVGGCAAYIRIQFCEHQLARNSKLTTNLFLVRLGCWERNHGLGFLRVCIKRCGESRERNKD